MPFCTQCGAGVDPAASYCAQCGTKQPQVEVPFSGFLDNMSERTASILCYIPGFGVIPAIVFLVSQRFRGNVRVRFNAFQSLYLFVTWLIVSSALPVLIMDMPGWGFEHLLVPIFKAGLFICWVYLLIKASQTEEVRLPILGDLAARSTMEQL